MILFPRRKIVRLSESNGDSDDEEVGVRSSFYLGFKGIRNNGGPKWKQSLVAAGTAGAGIYVAVKIVSRILEMLE